MSNILADENKQLFKALIVDDEENIREILSRIIEMSGLSVESAKDGIEALEKFASIKPDIIFSDIYMPRMNGMELLKKIKETDEKVPVILFTGYAHYRQILENMEIKPDNFIEKPFEVKHIIEILLFYFPQLRIK